ncbi:MAG: Lrp/AsnC family transcriptional regulator, partial [Chloroflexi bacterium]|nr:Lrp/AsnC family transcriptional regulator [Chloroflexota bacterium]
MRTRLDPQDYRIINNTQGGFPLVPRPFKELGDKLGMSEQETLGRIRNLVAKGTLSRFGVVLNPRRLGGNSSLAAIAVPPDRLEEVIAIVNSRPEVSHNYEREHRFNLWFVVSTVDPAGI